MRRDAEYFKEEDVVLVHIAKRLREAVGAEEALTRAGISFCVETDEYEGGLIFRTTRTGAFFYVGIGDEESAVAALQAEGYRVLPVDLRSRH